MVQTRRKIIKILCEPRKKKIILFRVQECDKIIDEKTDENEISSKDTINSHAYYFYEILCS